jgi:hypothetical protein
MSFATANPKVQNAQTEALLCFKEPVQIVASVLRELSLLSSEISVGAFGF